MRRNHGLGLVDRMVITLCEAFTTCRDDRPSPQIRASTDVMMMPIIAPYRATAWSAPSALQFPRANSWAREMTAELQRISG